MHTPPIKCTKIINEEEQHVKVCPKFLTMLSKTKMKIVAKQSQERMQHENKNKK
jgi:hypothetical protein